MGRSRPGDEVRSDCGGAGHRLAVDWGVNRAGLGISLELWVCDALSWGLVAWSTARAPADGARGEIAIGVGRRLLADQTYG